MSNNVFVRSLRPFAAVVGGSAGATALVGWTAPTWRAAWRGVRHPSSDPNRLVEDAVVILCSAGIAGALLWLSVCVLVCTVDALGSRGVAPTDSRSGVLRPRLVRALVAAALGTAVTAGGAAASPAGEPRPPEALDGLALPDRAYGGVHTHRVRAGESLWSITAGHLRPDSPASVVARRWPRLHHLNRERIGHDPHLIHSGTTLRIPTWGPAPTRGAHR